MLELIILVLTLCWALGFFGQSIVPDIRFIHGFTDLLAIVIILLIMFRFLT